MKKILLDTNAYSRFLAGDKHVLESLDKAETVYMSVFVIAELLYGFKGGNRLVQNREILNNFLNKSPIEALNATQETADIFSDIKLNLKHKGQPIPINDVWIAAHTLETGSVLISYDNHFKHVDGLRIWDRLFL